MKTDSGAIKHGRMPHAILHLLWQARGLDTFPSIYNALHLLAEAGIESDVATPSSVDGCEGWVREHIPMTGHFFTDAQALTPRLDLYDTVVAYEPRDFAMLGVVSRRRKGMPRLVFHNLEIETDAFRGKPLLTIAKNLARRFAFLRAYRQLHSLIIQDLLRYKLFCREYGSSRVPVYLVPNSYIPQIEPQASGLPWFDRLASNRTRILYVGSLNERFLPETAISSMANARDCQLIISGWGDQTIIARMQKRIDRERLTNVVLHVGKLTRGELNYLVARCDVGFCPYKSDTDNERCIGMSSGKYHKFLSYEKPVMVGDDVLGLSEFTESNGFGRRLREGDTLPDVARAIRSLYDQHVQCIRRHYASLCSYASPYREFISDVLLAPSSASCNVRPGWDPAPKAEQSTP